MVMAAQVGAPDMAPAVPNEDPLRALKGDIWNALWPTYPGSLYGRAARDPERKAQLDAELRELLEFFGRERIMNLALQFHIEMSKGRTPPRTFLGHMDKLRKRMLYEITLHSDDLSLPSSSSSCPSCSSPSPGPYKPPIMPPEQEQINQQGIAAARKALSHHRKQDPAAYDQADRVRAAEGLEQDWQDEQDV